MSEEIKLTSKQLIWKPVLTMFGAHIGGIIMSFIFCIGLGGLMSGKGYFIAIPLVLIVYLVPAYNVMWTAGNRDLNRSKYDHAKKNIGRGFIIALIVNSINIVTGILFVMSKFNLFYNFTILFRNINAEVGPILFAIQEKTGLPQFTMTQTLLYFLVLFIPVIFEGLFYIVGHKDVSLTQLIFYKNDKKKNDKQPKTSNNEKVI